jgi:hypothetical protein
MQTIYLGNNLINDVMLGSQRMDDVISFNYDNNALNFLNATGLFGQQPVSNAINALVTDLKGYGIWDKMYLAYPLVGGTASTHKVNLINTGSYELFFTGSWTHNSNGITGNGTNTFTTSSFFYEDVTNFGSNGSIGVYSRTNSLGGYDYGRGGGGAQFAIMIRYSNGLYYAGLPVRAGATVGNNNSTGSYSISFGAPPNTNNTIAYKNGIVQIDDNIIGSGVAATGQPSIGAARNTGLPAGAEDFSTRNYAWAFIGKGLTNQNHVDLNTSVVKFQTTLGRNV